jgi:hypothetical protein
MILDGCHDEDKIIIENIIRVIEHLKEEKIFTSWKFDAKDGTYILTAYINDSTDFELLNSDLNTIQEVNPLRIIAVSTTRVDNKMAIRVRVSDRNEPIILSETQLVTLRKRARFAI